MTRCLFQLLFVSVFAVLVCGGPVILTKDNFEAETATPTFIKFYAPWCGHCVALAPAWDSLAEQVNNELSGKAKVGKVDCTVESDLSSKYDIRGYPTLLMLKNGEKIQYQGSRDQSALFEFVKKNVE